MPSSGLLTGAAEEKEAFPTGRKMHSIPESPEKQTSFLYQTVHRVVKKMQIITGNQ